MPSAAWKYKAAPCKKEPFTIAFFVKFQWGNYTFSGGASWRYWYKRGSSFLKRCSNDEGALHNKLQKQIHKCCQ